LRCSDARSSQWLLPGGTAPASGSECISSVLGATTASGTGTAMPRASYWPGCRRRWRSMALPKDLKSQGQCAFEGSGREPRRRHATSSMVRPKGCFKFGGSVPVMRSSEKGSRREPRQEAPYVPAHSGSQPPHRSQVVPFYSRRPPRAAPYLFAQACPGHFVCTSAEEPPSFLLVQNYTEC
jgi:hypothetical protein